MSKEIYQECQQKEDHVETSDQEMQAPAKCVASTRLVRVPHIHCFASASIAMLNDPRVVTIQRINIT